MRNVRQKKKEGQERETLVLSLSDVSDQKFGLQPSKTRRMVWQERTTSKSSHLLWKI